MKFGKTALRALLPTAAMVLALLCPLPVLAAGVGASVPVRVSSAGTADTLYTINITPLGDAPAPAQAALQTKGGTVEFTGLTFDEPGDYCYRVWQTVGNASGVTYDRRSYTVTVRAANRGDGTLYTRLWAVQDGMTGKAGEILFANSYNAPTAATTTTTTTQTTVVKTVAAPPAKPTALPKTGDALPLGSLVAALCASVVGFGTAWRRK